MIIRTYPDTNSAKVLIDVPATGATIVLHDDCFVTVDGDRITSLELLNASQYGPSFDETVAKRLLVWAREQLDARAAS